MVRGKFRLVETTEHAGYPGGKYLFHPIQDTSIPENAQFTKATPNGRIEITVNNPPAQAQFHLGDYYYVDFTPVALASGQPVGQV